MSPARSIRELVPRPVVVAPMAGGPTTVELVIAAAGSGALGFLAAGYRPAGALSEDIARLRAASVVAFGVNVFAPGAPTADPRGLQAYLGEIGASPDAPRWDDDDWGAKVDLLLAEPVPAVSFTFGCPTRDVVESLQARGTLVIATITDIDEAVLAASTGVDALCAQGIEAGAHRGTFVNAGDVESGHETAALVALVRTELEVPVIAAGGIMDARDVSVAVAAGADAVQCGTALLLCDESGAHATYRAALVDGRFTETELTRAFSGRPARSLRNQFLRDHRGAPAAYPEVNNATRPMRAAAAAAGDAERMSLWAGTGWQRATGGPAGEIVERLAAGFSP